MRLSNTHARCAGDRRDGFTLVEVLASLLVLAVGLLGLASLTVGSLRGSRTALQHTGATILLADLADRIRANRAGGTAYELAAGTALGPATLTCTAVGECTASALAALDLRQWQAEVLATLPEAQTAVTVADAGTAGVHSFEITLRWRQPGDASLAQASLTVHA